MNKLKAWLFDGYSWCKIFMFSMICFFVFLIGCVPPDYFSIKRTQGHIRVAKSLADAGCYVDRGETYFEEDIVVCAPSRDENNNE